MLHGWPAIGISSLMPTQMPSSGRGASPCAGVPLLGLARLLIAWSKYVMQSAFTVGSTSAARATSASVSSTGERERSRNRASASVAER